MHIDESYKMVRQGKARGIVTATLLVLATASITVAEEAKEKKETKGLLDKPLVIGDSDMTIQFGGFAKVDFIQDFSPVGNQDQFKVNSIPVSGDPDSELGGATNISAKQTRLSADVKSNTSAGEIRVYIEGDFFGNSGSSFRLRHGYGEWNGLLGGQTWSTFQDISARPFTLDYEGPDSEIFIRQPQIRYTCQFHKKVQFQVAVEDPDSQVTVTGSAVSGRSEIPDIPMNVRFHSDWGHVQAGAILRQLRYVATGVDESTFGYGFNLSSKINVAKRDAIMGQVGFGTGIGRYVESFNGTGSDAVLSPSGDLEALSTLAFVLGYTHHWNDILQSTFSGGMAQLDTDASQPNDAIKQTQSAHANLVYTPSNLMAIGGELMWGERENKDGDSGDAVRLQVSLTYKFN